ncbi:hypothetical protein L218DRAFT_650598 [Marasmius fiardii PR-910]|nr:hypothetical protein L218DRAFT_650598 [Marasmius fiardii PR-910]
MKKKKETRESLASFDAEVYSPTDCDWLFYMGKIHWTKSMRVATYIWSVRVDFERTYENRAPMTRHVLHSDMTELSTSSGSRSERFRNSPFSYLTLIFFVLCGDPEPSVEGRHFLTPCPERTHASIGCLFAAAT